MPINTQKLVAAAMLQDLLVDKNGQPMAGGTITLYHDNARTTLKDWYYQVFNGGYTYPALPNPMTLSAAGTIADVNGNDVIPFYYPWNENDENMLDTYYVVIQNAAGTYTITRENFPLTSAGGGNITTLDSFNNLIINNGFWRNIAPNSLQYPSYQTVNLQSSTKGTGPYSLIVAPSQHDGFRMPDIQFVMTTQSGTDVLTFTPFPLGITQPILNTISPEFYINHACTVVGAGVKYYQFPISLHVNTLEGVTFTGSIQAQAISGSNQITISILQDTGTGGGAGTTELIATFNLTQTWATYTFGGTFNQSAGLTLGNGADDAYYLLVGLSSSATSTLNFTAPTLYLTNNVLPTNEFRTYDQVDAIINSPRTGDIRTGLNSFAPYGWVAMNDGSIGTTASNATARNNADTWQLYNLIYTSVLDHWAPVSGGRTAPGNTTAAAYADFSADKRLTLPRALGRVLMGENGATTVSQTFTTNYGASHFNLTVASSLQYPTGTPVQLTNTGGAFPPNIAANIIYYVIKINGTTIQLASSVINAYVPTPIDLGGDASGTSTVLTALGSWIGESDHQLISTELPSPITSTAASINVTISGNSPVIAASATPAANGFVANLAGNQGHNTIQPSTLMNIYIKL